MVDDRPRFPGARPPTRTSRRAGSVRSRGCARTAVVSRRMLRIGPRPRRRPDDDAAPRHADGVTALLPVLGSTAWDAEREAGVSGGAPLTRPTGRSQRGAVAAGSQWSPTVPPPRRMAGQDWEGSGGFALVDMPVLIGGQLHTEDEADRPSSLVVARPRAARSPPPAPPRTAARGLSELRGGRLPGRRVRAPLGQLSGTVGGEDRAAGHRDPGAHRGHPQRRSGAGTGRARGPGRRRRERGSRTSPARPPRRRYGAGADPGALPGHPAPRRAGEPDHGDGGHRRRTQAAAEPGRGQDRDRSARVSLPRRSSGSWRSWGRRWSTPRRSTRCWRVHHVADPHRAREIGEVLVTVTARTRSSWSAKLPPVLSAHVGLGRRRRSWRGPPPARSRRCEGSPAWRPTPARRTGSTSARRRPLVGSAARWSGA
ncbi:hypothetical protein QJS66_03790 [Kocuria rhizophila]|nr:hypothetical protein QJS66_03790 [Kocuria rhizophila]